MTKRKPMSKKDRFEIFKRDSFTCQYCGRSAPDAILQVDHIAPVSEGGDDDLTNLVTSCLDCNQGKSNRLLSDDAVIKQRKRQLDELQERREQLEMMMEWQRSLIDLEQFAVEELGDLWQSLAQGFILNTTGLRKLKKTVAQYGLGETAECMRISTRQYLEYEPGKEKPTQESVEKAFDYIRRIAASRKKMAERPYLADLYHARNILHKRLPYIRDWEALDLMEAALLAGVSAEQIKACARTIRNWSSFRDIMELWATSPEAANDI